MRSLHRWISRLLGFVLVMGVAQFLAPSRQAPVVAVAETPRAPHLAALRIAPLPTLAPDLKLWGAGPAMDLQWQVSATMLDEPQDDVEPTPAATPRRKSQPDVRRRAPTPERDWRHDLVYDPISR